MRPLVAVSSLEFDVASPLLRSYLSDDDFDLVYKSLVLGLKSVDLHSNPKYVRKLRHRVLNKVFYPFLNSFLLPFKIPVNLHYYGLRMLSLPKGFVFCGEGVLLNLDGLVRLKDRVALASERNLPFLDFDQVCCFTSFSEARKKALRYFLCQGMTLEKAGLLSSMSRQNVSNAAQRFMPLLSILDESIFILNKQILFNNENNLNTNVYAFVGLRKDFLQLLSFF